MHAEKGLAAERGVGYIQGLTKKANIGSGFSLLEKTVTNIESKIIE